MRAYYQDEAVTIYHGDCREIMRTLGTVDHVITDPPYSERTHAGHNAAASSGSGVIGVAIDYASLTVGEATWLARELVEVSGGWCVALSDHELIGAYTEGFCGAGYYSFHPIPCVIKGMSLRLLGDGPSSWAVYANVARPAALARWGTLPGAYVGSRERQHRIGGKPEWLMRALVRDYSREGETILDPYMGAGTTLRAAKDLGRKAIGIEIDEEACEFAARRMAQEVLPW